MKRHCTAVLSAMMTGMDDRDDPDDEITLEAMTGLSKVLAKVEEDSVRAILLNISLRIRPCFEKDKVCCLLDSFFLFFNCVLAGRARCVAASFRQSVAVWRRALGGAVSGTNPRQPHVTFASPERSR
jgi:hypothetical protein